MKAPCKLGITGCIGSGKSIVSAILRIMGIPVYDCDTNAKALMNNNEEIRNKLVAEFGNNCYSENNILNKKFLASLIFENPIALNKINKIVHPEVKNDFVRWSIRQKAEIVGLESAILFESGFDDIVDYTIATYADKETCISRACKRDKSTRKDIITRMEKQLPKEKSIKMSDFKICNNENTPILPQIEKLISSLTEKAS